MSVGSKVHFCSTKEYINLTGSPLNHLILPLCSHTVSLNVILLPSFSSSLIK